MSLNKALIIGNLTRDPEVRATPSGQQVATFSVATNRAWTNSQTGQKQESSEFHNVVAWGKLAEIASKYLAKGRRVYVEGRIQTRDWTGQDGVKRYRTEIVVENFIMLDRAPSGSSEGPFTPTQPAASDTGGDQPFPPDSGEPEIQLENIPF